MTKAYTSDLTVEQYELIKPLIPAAKPGGRPREVSMWYVLNAIFDLVTQGCKWRDLPSDFPAWQTVYRYFRNWRFDGTWLVIHDRLHSWTRVAVGRDESPFEAILDSQSVPTDTMVHEEVGFDGAKKVKGRKRHMTVDTLGLVLRVLVTAASIPEREGGQQVLEKVKQMGQKVSRLYLVWVDGGYSGNPFVQWAMDTLHLVILVLLRPEQAKGFVLQKKRWVVERTFCWLNWYRRLSKDYEHLPENSEVIVYIAMIQLMVRRLA
ncbi:MAG: IS5 family transposase [Hormoscilla sp. GUM202]|nr:IS5 family transposase [Hormoscilla sp. GUM202]